MTTKQYSLGGVNESVELGKDGHVIDGSNASYVKVTDSGDTLLPVKGGQSTAADEFVTQAQLDGVEAIITGDYNAFSYDATGALTQLNGEGSGDSGAILRGDKYKISNDGTVLTESVNDGDVLVALVDDAPLSGTSPTPTIGTHWLVVKIKDANDLADGTTTEAVSGKVTVKDSGVSTDKIANSAVTLAKMAANSVDSDQYVDGSIDNAHYADVSITDAKIASATVTKAKLVAGVQTTLTNADTEYGTRTPNFESAIGGSFDSDNDSSIAAQTNYATSTTITGQLSQLDARQKLDNDENALRINTSVSHDGGAQNVGSAIKSGRTITAIKVKPTTVANGSGCTMSIGISGSASKYVAVADIDLYESTVQVVNFADTLSSDEQIVATVTQGTATAGTFTVVVEHG